MRRYNAPTIDIVAIVMVGDQFLPRVIILHKRNAQLVRIAESNAKPGLRLKEKVKKECVSRNFQSISEELPVVYPQVLRS